MDRTKDVPENPPAFPMGNPEQGGYDGMTLRDWIAGQAVGGFCANPASMQWIADENDLKVNAPLSDFAKEAYALADAMLAARKDQQP